MGAERRARRLARYTQVLALREWGKSTQAIAQQLGLDPKTVRAWLAAGAFPERCPRTLPQRKVLDRHADYISGRYAEGLDNARVLEGELRQRGFRGSSQAVIRYLRHLRRTRARGRVVTRVPPARPRDVKPASPHARPQGCCRRETTT